MLFQGIMFLTWYIKRGSFTKEKQKGANWHLRRHFSLKRKQNSIFLIVTPIVKHPHPWNCLVPIERIKSLCVRHITSCWILKPTTTPKLSQPKDSCSRFSKPERGHRGKAEGKTVSGHRDPDTNESAWCDTHRSETNRPVCSVQKL